MCATCFWRQAWPARLLAPAEAESAVRRIPIRVETDVDGAPGWISGDVFLPDAGSVLRKVILFCFPGGGVTRQYFDISGEATFSFARAMTDFGFVCVTFDHPGTGESFVPDDGFALDAVSIADAGTQAVQHVTAKLRQGELDPGVAPMGDCVHIGIGHSMGAMIVILQQSVGPLYDGAALLCFTTRGLPEVLTEEERAAAASSLVSAADFSRLARARFGEPFPMIAPARGDSPAARALASVAGALAATSAMQSMLPGNVARAAALLTTNLFLAAGDRDLTGPPHAIPSAFTGCNDLRLVVVPGAGHHPFVTAGAPRLYACLAEWIDDVPVVR
jgi:pimeloyl-ACP methyl ester carboxylesterase